jgi:hypothetical protein
MALPTNTFATYEAIGNREDLSDVIYRIDPTDTPFMSGIEREKASAVNHEWQTQSLAAADNTNAQLEGDDANTNTTTATVRLGNINQISTKVARVTGTQRSVDHAGRDDELAYQEMLKGLELKRDMETILAGTNQAKATGNDTTARKTASVLSWIKSNTSKGTAGGAADPSTADGAGTRTDGTQIAFTEARLKTVLQSIWTNGGKPDVIMTGAFNKQVFSTFTGRAPRSSRPRPRRSSRRSMPMKATSACSRSRRTASSARATCSCCGWRCGRSPSSTAGAWCPSPSPRPAIAIGACCSPSTPSLPATRRAPAACSTTPRRK